MMLLQFWIPNSLSVLTLLEQPVTWLKIHLSYFRCFLTQVFCLIFWHLLLSQVLFLHLFSQLFFLALIPFSCSSHRFHVYNLHFLPNLYFLLLSQKIKNKNWTNGWKNIPSKFIFFFRLFTGLLFKFNIVPSSSSPQTYWDLLFFFFFFFKNKQTNKNADFSMMIWHKKVTILSIRWLLPLILPASITNSGFPA